MYDMYPDWGPAKHRDDAGGAGDAAAAGVDQRDGAAQRPDDN